MAGRTAARTDANQSAIVGILRRAGATVQSLASVGRGVPDLLIGYQGRNYLAEVKDGSKRPSDRRLTDDERRWLVRWTGQAAVIETALEALNLIGLEPDQAITICAEQPAKKTAAKKTDGEYLCPVHSIRLRYVLKGGAGHCRVCWQYVQAAGIPMPSPQQKEKKREKKK
ncbi:MAG: hypothetical protein ACREEM_12995 [Blastocatellia bacterium]